ncbi:imidazole glycerol phosphate synthase subunit HisH [Candidatus Pelagibacter sp.]|jgi:glutamine amidotransferase|nr:imidazole glycerol phosphate synthase subunit HisH [Candidatus Pelagibacter sp.]
MNIAIIDYESGNIRSVINSFKKVCTNQNIEIEIKVTSDLKTILSSDKIILPGQGSFKNCTESLEKIKGLKDTLNEFAIIKKKPLFGICVGMQMFADVGYEETETKGLGWITGKVSKINNQDGKYKLPHIGWNQINIVKKSKIYNNIKNNSHLYFVHSYEFIPEDRDVVSATTEYSSNIVCSVEKENIFGTQFHPEKSDKEGLKIIENFINL